MLCGEGGRLGTTEEWGWNGTATYYWDDVTVEPSGNQIDFTIDITGNCLPATVQLKGAEFLCESTWNWEWGDGTRQSGQTVQRAFPENGTYRAELTMTVDGHVFTTSKNFEVSLPPAPVADFDWDNTPYQGRPVSFDNLSQHADSWLWAFGDSTTSTEESPKHTFEEFGDFQAMLIAANETGCQDTSIQEIYIACSGKLTANAFTPNGDGHNDVFPFEQLAQCGGPFTIQIFNRWGNMVYESNDPSAPWRADNVPVGTYYYMARYKGGEQGGYIDVIR